MKSSENLPLGAVGAANVLRGTGVLEAGTLFGVYDAVNRGPVEHLRAEYTQMSLAINKFLAEQDEISAFKLMKHRDAIPIEEKWQAQAPNTVMTEGANFALDTILNGSSYTKTGPYMGLISSSGWTATAITDVAANVVNGSNGWKEAGGSFAPTYTAPRKTCAWSSAGSKSIALSSALSFPITGSGVVKGCFIIYGPSAVSTIADTNGKLFSAGVFSGGDKTVAASDTLSVSYTASVA